MGISLICASHTPLLHRVVIDDSTNSAVKAGFERLAKHIREFSPDYVIQFSPDHYQGFFHRLMPSFCLGLAAESAEDWDISGGALDVPIEKAKALALWLRDHDFDISISRAMKVDHGFLQIWQEMFGGFREVPIVPIFINSIAPPLSRYQRIRQLGETIGKFICESGDRVLVVGSGGLSHDPPVPDIDTVSPAVKPRLIQGQQRSKEEKADYEKVVTQAGLDSLAGKGPCRPLNPEWDKCFLDVLRRGDLEEFDSYTDIGVIEEAGRAANEVLSWVAAFSALSAQGSYEMDLVFHEPIPDWIVSMAMVTAQPKC